MFDKLFGKKEPAAVVNSTVDSLGASVSNLVSEVNPLEGMTVKEKNELSNTLARVSSILAYVIIIIVPLLFVPILSDSFDLPKQTLLFFLAGIALMLLFVKGLISKKFTLTVSPLHLPVLAFLIVTVISAFLADNRFAALSADTVAVAGSAFIFFVLSSINDKNNFLNRAVTGLVASGAALAVLSSVQLVVQLLPATLINSFGPIKLFLNPTFSPAGSSLSQGLFLLVILPISIALYLHSKNKNLSVALLGLNVLGLLTTAYVLYVSQPVLLDQITGWKIAVNALGGAPQILTAFFGVGPGHFIDAFGAFKPLTFNDSPWWNLRFSTSSNYYFYVLTSFGIAGLASMIFLVARFGRMAKARLQTDSVTLIEKGLIISATLSLVLFIIFPAPLVSIFVLFVTLGLLVNNYSEKSLSLFAHEIELSNSSLKYVLTAGLAVVLICWAYLPGQSFGLLQFTAADYFFASSLQAAAQNQGQQTYDNQIKALNLNPWNSSYRISYSQTNLALANSLAGQKNLNDQQKQIVVQLVQQSLRESRIAASLQPHRAGNWENLSLIYRNLINFAQGADQWSVQTQQQAIQLDPTNPRLRLDLGGILFAAKDYQNAAQIFNQAAGLKADFANAHYNLAQALKQLNIKDQALQQLQLTGQLVCTPTQANAQAATSLDCQKVTAEANDLTKEISAGATKENTPNAEVKPTTVQTPLASPGATPVTNLPNAKTTPPAQVGSQSGEINP